MSNQTFFHKRIVRPAGCWGRFLHGLVEGFYRALRVFDRSGGIPPALERALSKRELEKKLLAKGYTLKLAKIAVSEEFLDRSKPYLRKNHDHRNY